MTDIEAQHLGGVPWDWSQDLSGQYSKGSPNRGADRFAINLDDLELQEFTSQPLREISRSPSHISDMQIHQSQIPTSDNKILADRILGKPKARRKFQTEDLPFCGPEDPQTWPLHKILFLTGLLFPPCWFIGAIIDAPDDFSGLSRWRCQVMTMLVAIIVVALLILELGF